MLDEVELIKNPKLLEEVEAELYLNSESINSEKLIKLLWPSFTNTINVLKLDNACYVECKTSLKGFRLRCIHSDQKTAFVSLYYEIIKLELFRTVHSLQGRFSARIAKLADTCQRMMDSERNLFLTADSFSSVPTSWHYQLTCNTKKTVFKRLNKIETYLTSKRLTVNDDVTTLIGLLEIVCPSICVHCVQLNETLFLAHTTFNGQTFMYIGRDAAHTKRNVMVRCMRCAFYQYSKLIRNCFIDFPETVRFFVDELKLTVNCCNGAAAAVGDKQAAVADKRVAVDDKQAAVADKRVAVADKQAAVGDKRAAGGDIITATMNHVKKLKLSAVVNVEKGASAVETRQSGNCTNNARKRKEKKPNSVAVNAALPTEGDRLYVMNLLENSLKPSAALLTEGDRLNVMKLPGNSPNPSDIVSGLVLEKYVELCKTYNLMSTSVKVLAGVVMVENDDFVNGATLIAVCAGNKIVDGKQLSDSGDAVVDMHAEILARRALLCYFYSQLELLKIAATASGGSNETSNNSVFERIVGGSEPSVRLRNGLSFHLYVSSAPCGDGRLFTISNEAKTDVKNAGRLRIKLEHGNGATLGASRSRQVSFEDIKRGYSFCTMCCSDKLLARNVLGVQGSLLSTIISQPIYYSSIVVGDYFNLRHLQRALYDRLKECEQQYRIVHKPAIYGTGNEFVSNNATQSKYCFNWIVGENPPLERINSKTGKLSDDCMTRSRLCKSSLFDRYMQIINHDFSGCPLSYCDCKMSAKPYQKTKQNFREYFVSKQLGHWISVPPPVSLIYRKI